MSELHRQIKDALDGLVIPDLQNIVVQFIPIVKLEFLPGRIDFLIGYTGPVVIVKGTSARNDRNKGWGDQNFAEWVHGKQEVYASPLILTFPWGVQCHGPSDNPEFITLIDLRGIIFNENKSYTIDIDPDLDKILRVIEH